MARVEIHTEGLHDFSIRFRAIRDFREKVIDAMNTAARRSASYLQANAPYHSGQLYRAIYYTPARFAPGGGGTHGGGGEFEAVIGIDTEQAPHADWVLHGTGLYGPQNRFIFSPRPMKGRRNATMVFEKQGEGTVFTQNTVGQRARMDDWWENAQEIADREFWRLMKSKS